MRTKNVNLEWNILLYDWNSHKVVNYNVLYGESFKEELRKKVKKEEVRDLETLKEAIDSYCRYRFWARAEYEIMVGDLFPRSLDELEKIDAYRQIEMNLDRIVEYVNRALKLDFEK